MTKQLLGGAVAAVALAGCTPLLPYSQSQDELRTTLEKFGGKQVVAMPMDKLLNNVFLTTKHCEDLPVYTMAPDRHSLTATVMLAGWAAPAYQVVIDVAEVGDSVEISYWGQNGAWKRHALTWIEQMKNPEICKTKKD